MTALLKLLLSVTTLAVCVYGIGVFGYSMWPMMFVAASLFLLVSVFFRGLDTAAIVVARIMGVLSLLAVALLLLASTVGGSSNLSQSNQIIGMALALMAVLGCAFFLVPTARIEH